MVSQNTVLFGISLSAGILIGALIPAGSADSTATKNPASSRSPARGSVPEAGSILDPELDRIRKLHDPDAIFAELEQLRGLKDRRSDALFAWLIAKAAELDPRRTLGYLQDPELSALRRNGLPVLLNIWIARDLAGAIQAVSSLERGVSKQNIEAILVQAISEQQPDVAFELLLKNPSIPDNSLTLDPIYRTFMNWGRLDWATAEAKLASIDDPAARQNAIRGLARAKVSEGPASAFEWLDHLNDSDRGTAFPLLLNWSFTTDPKTTFDLVDSRVARLNEQEAAGFLSQSLSRMLEVDPERTLAMIRTRFGEDAQAESLTRRALAGLAAQEPEAGVNAIFERHPEFRDGPGPSDLQETLITAFSRTDPQKAKAWFAANAEALEPRVFSRALEVFPWTSPGEMADFSSGLPGKARENGLRFALSQWASQEPAKALEWAGSHLEGPMAEAITPDLEGVVALSRPETFAAVVASRQDSPQNHDLAQTTARQWAARDPEAAASWTTAIEDPSLRAAAIHEVTKQWLKQNEVSASGWIRELPEGEARNSAISLLVRRLEETDPESARAWKALLDKQPATPPSP